MSKRLRLAGALIVAGMTIQLITLMWNHPLAFLAFLFVGSPFVAAGCLVYLYSLVTPSDAGSKR